LLERLAKAGAWLSYSEVVDEAVGELVDRLEDEDEFVARLAQRALTMLKAANLLGDYEDLVSFLDTLG